MSRRISSPSRTSASGPPTAASGETCSTTVRPAVPLIRASETRTMSRTPAASSFFGIGSEPASGIPGPPTGPAFWSTRTLAGVTGSAGSSIRAARSARSRNTQAGPRWRRRAGVAADTLSTAPSGARLPRRMARPPSALNGRSRVVTTSCQAPGAVTSSSSAPSVRPVTVGASRWSSGASAFITAGMPPASARSSMWYLPDGRMLATIGVVRAKRSKSSSPSGTPARPAIAGRWTTALVEPPIAMQDPHGVLERRAGEDPGGPEVLPRAISTIRRPAASARRRRRESGAGMAAMPGSVMPRASVIAAIVLAVPMTMHVPVEGNSSP